MTSSELCGLTLSILLVLLPLLAALLYRMRKPATQYEGIPGPPPASSLFGNWWKIWEKKIDFEDRINSKLFGNVYETFEGNTSNLMINDPELIESILVKENSTCNRRAAEVRTYLSQSLMAVNCELAENESRKAIKAINSSQTLRRLVPRIRESINRLEKSFDKYGEHLERELIKIEITSAVTLFFEDIVSSVVFGLKDTTLEGIKKNCRGLYNGKYLKGLLNTFVHVTPALRKLDNLIATDEATKFFRELTKESLEKEWSQEEKEQENPSSKEDSIISFLAKLKNDNKSIEEEELLTECFSVILASALHLRHSLVVAIAQLALKPEFQDRIRREIVGQIHSEIMSFESIENADELDMFVKEILRLSPADFRIERKTIKPIKLEKLEIPENRIIVFPVAAIHHLEKYYPEPETFNPGRFSGEKGRQLLESHAFLPFGQGHSDDFPPLSIRFALFVLKMTIAQLVLNYRLENDDEVKSHVELEKGTLIARALPVYGLVKKR